MATTEEELAHWIRRIAELEHRSRARDSTVGAVLPTLPQTGEGERRLVRAANQERLAHPALLLPFEEAVGRHRAAARAGWREDRELPSARSASSPARWLPTSLDLMGSAPWRLPRSAERSATGCYLSLSLKRR